MSNNAEKISVIVPCYNVGAYVEKCLLSILNQHYTNIEVWAVDDGSADGTPAVLDRLARQYPQLKVIHQKNAGVSAARNTGLAHAKGDYVVFVDGDDYLAPDYMDYMLELVHKTGADFALSTQWFRKKTDKQTSRPSMQTVSPAQAVALLLSPNVVVGCWNKIYKRSLLTRHQCRFNTELFYGEGLNFIITVAQLAGKIAVGNRKVYYYRRNNAASATTRFNIHTLQSNTQSLDLIEQNLKVRTNDIDVMLTLHRSLFYLSTAVRIQTAGKTRTYQTEYKKCMAYVRKHFFKLLFKRQVSLYRKAMLAAGCLCPRLLAKMDVIRRKRIAAQSVGE